MSGEWEVCINIRRKLERRDEIRESSGSSLFLGYSAWKINRLPLKTVKRGKHR